LRLPSAIALCLIAAPALAQAPGPSGTVSDPPGTISVRAAAHRRLANTVADASVAVEAHGRDVPGTARLLAEASQSLLGYLRGAHADRLRTEATAFEPETQQARGQPDRITGFTGRTGVSFRTTPDALPALLAGSLDHGANALQQSGSSPRDEEVDRARDELAAEVTRTALAQAAVAQAAGQRVTGVAEIVVDGPERPMRPMMAMARSAAPPVAQQAGDTEVTVGVLVKVRIGP